MILLIGILIGFAVAYVFGEVRDKKANPAPKDSSTVTLLRRQLADAATVAEVEGDILAVCAARGWEIESTYARRVRSLSFSYSLMVDEDAEYARLKDWWTVNNYSAPSLAEAWDMACAHSDASEKVKAKHRKDEAAT